MLRITSPQAGATVTPQEPILGDGATPEADVNLLWTDDAIVATVAAGADGSFAFEGSTPMSVGEATFVAESEGSRSEPVTFTVAEEEPVPPEGGESPNTPAEPAEYPPADPPDAYEENTNEQFVEEGTTATGEPPHPELPTTNAYPGGGLPMTPGEPYPTGNPPADGRMKTGRP